MGSLKSVFILLFVGRHRREAALLVEQAVVSQRAMRHAAWGAKKDIKSKLQSIKKSPYKAITRAVHPQDIQPPFPPPRPRSKGEQGRVTGKESRIQTPRGPSTPAAGRSVVSPPVAKSAVLATPTGFKKVRDTSPQTTPTKGKTQPSSERDPALWKIGEDYGMFFKPDW